MAGIHIKTAAPPSELAARSWQPVSIGPHFDWLDHDNIRITEGPLDGHEFGIATEIGDDRAACFLDSRDRRLGQCLVERDPPGSGLVLWDTGVHPDLRRGGLCAVMTWVLLRELVPVQRETSFRIRMITSVKADEETGLRNVGICVVACRLGLTSDFRAAELLASDNITGMRLLPAQSDQPYGLLATIRTYPLSVVSFALDPDTLRPVANPRVYEEMIHDPQLARDWAARGYLVISNGDWSLRKDGVERFLGAIALSETEAAQLRPRIRPYPEPGRRPHRPGLFRLRRNRVDVRP